MMQIGDLDIISGLLADPPTHAAFALYPEVEAHCAEIALEDITGGEDADGPLTVLHRTIDRQRASQCEIPTWARGVAC